ncbi:hypothetical protein Tco_1021756 [Tanacetum coccineum]
MNMTLQSSIKDRILAAQNEASDESARLQKGLDKMIKLRNDGALYYLDRIWVPLKGDVRTLIMDEAHKLKYYVKVEHQRSSGLLQQPEIPEWKWKGIAMDFSVHIEVLVVNARGIRNSFRHEYDLPPLDRCVRCAPFEALYGRKCRSLIMWVEVGEGQLIGPELVQETTEKILQIKDRLKAACDCQKSYADKRRMWDNAFGKKGKLAPRFVGPFEIIEKVGLVAYLLDLPKELNCIHDTFHVSKLKRCLADPTLQVPLDEIRVDDKLNFVEEPMKILEREIKKLKRSRIAIVGVW